uniref:DOMON domain-containing protein n=1 Tax=Timema shepardi TaxID=629360 RepID=A0A7R9B7P6_TIMSH|nr:unnamed protein product [Timema shepardi]
MPLTISPRPLTDGPSYDQPSTTPVDGPSYNQASTTPVDGPSYNQASTTPVDGPSYDQPSTTPNRELIPSTLEQSLYQQLLFNQQQQQLQQQQQQSHHRFAVDVPFVTAADSSGNFNEQIDPSSFPEGDQSSLAAFPPSNQRTLSSPQQRVHVTTFRPTQLSTRGGKARDFKGATSVQIVPSIALSPDNSFLGRADVPQGSFQGFLANNPVPQNYFTVVESDSPAQGQASIQEVLRVRPERVQGGGGAQVLRAHPDHNHGGHSGAVGAARRHDGRSFSHLSINGAGGSSDTFVQYNPDSVTRLSFCERVKPQQQLTLGKVGSLAPGALVPHHRLRSKLNCEVLWDDLALEVRWAVAGDSVVMQLVSKLEDGEYMSFGLSGDNSRSRMIGGDVVVAWVDKDTLKGYAQDYFLDSKSQCAGTRGSCPDNRLRDNTNSVRLLNAAMVNGYSIVTYQRPLGAQDELDRAVLTNGSQPVIWAVGPLNSRNEVSYHSITSKGRTSLGR